MSTFLLIQSWYLSAERHCVRSALKSVDDTTWVLQNVTICSPKKSGWLSFLGLWCPSWHWLFWYRSDLVLPVNWGGNWSWRKGRKTGFIPAGLAVMGIQSWLWLCIKDGSRNHHSFGLSWLQCKELLTAWLLSVNSLVAATVPPAPPPLVCTIVREEFPTFLLSCSWSRELQWSSETKQLCLVSCWACASLRFDFTAHVRLSSPSLHQGKKTLVSLCLLADSEYFVHGYFYSFITQLIESHFLTMVVANISLTTFGSLKLG